MSKEAEGNLELTSLTGFLLRLAHVKAQRSFLDVFGNDGLSSLQFSIVIAVHNRPEITHNELVDVVHGTKSILTTATKPLIAKGLISQLKDARDQRVTKYILTSKGQALIPDLLEKIKKADEIVIDTLTPEQVEQLKGYLRVIARQ